MLIQLDGNLSCVGISCVCQLQRAEPHYVSAKQKVKVSFKSKEEIRFVVEVYARIFYCALYPRLVRGTFPHSSDNKGNKLSIQLLQDGLS